MLSGNRLTGTIPAELYDAKRLELLGGNSMFINSQTRPLHASKEDETKRQGSSSP